MRKLIPLTIVVLAFTVFSCNHSPSTDQGNLHKSSEDLIFPQGHKIENDRFHGTAWLQSLVVSDSTNHIAVGSVTFEPGARTNWHLHPDGQIILATGGVGYYQEEGSPKKILNKGDVITCPSNIPHWHGASPDKAFIQIAITSRKKGPTEWLHPVTDEEYQGGEK